MVEVAWVKWALNLSKEPKFSSMAVPSSPSGLSPPSGLRFFQKIEWRTWPEMWKARVFSRPTIGAEVVLVPGRRPASPAWGWRRST